MKIKIIPRWEKYMAQEGCEQILYDVYHGFNFLGFFTKWKLDKSGLDGKEMEKYLQPYLFGYSPNIVSKIIIKV